MGNNICNLEIIEVVCKLLLSSTYGVSLDEELF